MKRKPLRASMSFNPQEVAWMALIMESLRCGKKAEVPECILRQLMDKAENMKDRIAEVKAERL